MNNNKYTIINKNKKIEVEEGDNIVNISSDNNFNLKQSFENTSGVISDTEYEVTAESTDFNNNDIPNKKRS